MCLTENRSRSLYSVHLYTPPPRVMAELLPELLTEHLAPASWPGDPGLRVAGHLGKLLPEHKDHTANHFLSQLGRAIFEDKLNQSPVETAGGATMLKRARKEAVEDEVYSSALWQSQRSFLSFQPFAEGFVPWMFSFCNLSVINTWHCIMVPSIAGSGHTVHYHLIRMSCLVSPWHQPSLARPSSTLTSAQPYSGSRPDPGLALSQSALLKSHVTSWQLYALSEALMWSLSEISQLTKCERWGSNCPVSRVCLDSTRITAHCSLPRNLHLSLLSRLTTCLLQEQYSEDSVIQWYLVK